MDGLLRFYGEHPTLHRLTMRHDIPDRESLERRAAPPAGRSTSQRAAARPIDCGHDCSHDGELEPVKTGKAVPDAAQSSTSR
jgi:hypothetical protein